MAVDSKEVSKFTSGLIGSTSETDIGSDFATFSLNVDSEYEKGALRGIKGNYILGVDGWELPRYSRSRFRCTFNSIVDVNNKAFAIYGYNKKFLIYFDLTGGMPVAFQLEADSQEYEVIYVQCSTGDNVELVIQKTVDAINAVKLPYLLSQATGITNYFTASKTKDRLERDYIILKNNLLGDIRVPDSPTFLTSIGGVDYRTHNSNYTAADILLPISEFSSFENVITNSSGSAGNIISNAWDSSHDGFWVKGNGLEPESADDLAPLSFKFLKPVNQKGNDNLFGISAKDEAYIFDNLSDTNGGFEILGPVSISSNLFDISAEQRNTNLYIGTGDNDSNKSLWFGKIDRKQLDKTFNEEYHITKNAIENLGGNFSPLSIDNMVIPTLHYGLNSSNGGIAGSANIYTNADGDEWHLSNSGYTGGLNNDTYQRSVNSWAVQCLKNVTPETEGNYDTYNDFKLGMIFRLDLGGSYTVSTKSMSTGNANYPGEGSVKFLRQLKGFAKGEIDSPYNSGTDGNLDASIASDGGSDGEELHNGDLFQIVYVPDSVEEVNTRAKEGDTDLIRFAYVGHLIGDTLEGTNTDENFTVTNKGTDNPNVASHDSKNCYSGTPAYSFGHINSDSKLFRVRTSSKDESYLNSLATFPEIKDSLGNTISGKSSFVEDIDLAEELSIDGFKIGTIAECKSADGTGGFGGDTTNKNYYSGYGKLWISNINEYNKLYLVDISNWDNINADKRRLSYVEVTLNFNRIHDQLHATDFTSFQKGLVRLGPNTYGTGDYDLFMGDSFIWNNEPKNAFIGSICETYSHKPHLGDGALGGVNNGDGKWRVWVHYNKPENITFDRWDLFLFNFRPQGINPTAVNDIQGPLNSASNSEVFMYDKTPPYQEVAQIKLGSSENDSNKKWVCYPYDKFWFGTSTPDSDYRYNQSDGTSNSQGAEYFSTEGARGRKAHNSTNYEDSQKNMTFRNPSGEFITWEKFLGSEYPISGDHMMYRVGLGTNIGWLNKGVTSTENGTRSWAGSLHCMKPHFKEWYFTGNSSSVEDIARTERGNSVAHIVSFLGQLSGKFVTYGGEMRYWNSGGTVACYTGKERTMTEYSNDWVLYSMHDSPVAFADLTETDGTGVATFNKGETQGAPNTDGSTPEDFEHLGGSGDPYDGVEGGRFVFFNDTEAGFLTDKSVPATQGFSRFNQFRYAHNNNGTSDLEKDSGYGGQSIDSESDNSNMRHGYINIFNQEYHNNVSDRRGCTYDGADGFGHYNMVTTTWASNSEINNYNGNAGNMRTKTRSFGQGFTHLDIVKRRGAAGFGSFHRINSNQEADITRRHNISDANLNKVTKEKMGTGYLTYKWGHSEDPALAGTASYNAHYGGYGDQKSGYYSDNSGISFPTNAGLEPTGTRWDNRRTVFCWSTTCVSDSLFTRTDTSESFSNNIRYNDALTSPRCSFRKISLPSGYSFDSIKNMDVISWQQLGYGDGYNTNHTSETTKTLHGYIISGKAHQSPINDIDATSSIICVINHKGIDNNLMIENEQNGGLETTWDWRRNQSRQAVAPLIPLLKQHFANKKKYLAQIGSFTNDNLTFKNLNTGLADSPRAYNYWDRKFWVTQSGAEPIYLERNVRLDTYSPLIIGTGGDNKEELLSNWARPQFTPRNTASLGDMGLYPYYKYDRLWNYWSDDVLSPNNRSPLESNDLSGSDNLYADFWDETEAYHNQYSKYYNEEGTGTKIEAGFDNSVLVGNRSIKLHKKLSQNTGSSAGSIHGFNGSTATKDGAYPSYSDYIHENNSDFRINSHIKKIHDSILILDSFEDAEQDGEGITEGVNFKAGKIIYYSLSLVYDNFQESPLSTTFRIPGPTLDAKYVRLKLSLPSSQQLNLNPRATHINVYRKNNVNSLFRLVKSIAFNGKDDNFGTKLGRFDIGFNDEQTSVSYEGLNGIPETLTDLTPNYCLSTQLNDFLFIAKINHPKIENGEHILLRSKKGKFSIFDWSSDYLDLPTKPLALVAFANRIFMWDKTNTYIINPQGLYIEDKTDGIGILNSQSYVVTDIGMFFCDRNNIYIHNGKSATPIGDPILYNHSRPEWQIGYLDAMKKAELLGHTPKMAYDSTKQCIYVILQGYSDASTSNFNVSYREAYSRLYSFNIQAKRWDYYEVPNVKTVTTTGQGDVVMSDGYQIYNYRVDKRNKKAFNWESKEFTMGSSNYSKVFKRLYITGEMCLWNFNNSEKNAVEVQNDEEDWNGGLHVDTDIFYQVDDDTHLLETSPASETDDLKVYIDGVIQTMKIQDRKPHIGHYLANDKTGSIYTTEVHLGSFEGTDNNLTDLDGNPLTNAFCLNAHSLPEFVEPPNSQYPKVTKQGELEELTHIHKGQYLYISGVQTDGTKLEEIIKVRNLFIDWKQSVTGINDIETIQPIKITCFRGLLGTKAINWYDKVSNGVIGATGMNQIRIATPVLKFPTGSKGKNVKVVFNNQKSYIDSFAITYRKKRFK